MGRNIYRLRHARLTVLETRVPKKLETGKRVGISSLDLLLDDCKVVNSGKYSSAILLRIYQLPDTIWPTAGRAVRESIAAARPALPSPF
eukprot:31510_2